MGTNSYPKKLKKLLSDARAFDNYQPSVGIVSLVIDMRPEEMMLDTEILGPYRKSLICCKEIGTLVVFKVNAMDYRML